MNETLIDIYKTTLEKHADRVAYRMRPKFRRMEWTLKDLHRHAAAVAALLQKEGVGRGDRVLLWASNSPYWVAVYWGVLLRGAIMVPLHMENTADFIDKIAKETEAKILFKSAVFSYENEHLAHYTAEHITADDFAPDAHTYPYPSVRADDLAEIIYTSGTTGEPKGVMLSHGNIASNVRAIMSLVPIGPRDRFLSILPLAHMFEQTVGMLAPFACGASVAYVPRLSSKKIREALSEYRATKMLAVPQFLETVMGGIELEVERKGKAKLFARMRRGAEHIPFTLRRFLFASIHRKLGGKLTIVSSGGAPLDSSLEKKWELLGIKVLQGYGLSETAPIVSANTLAAHRFGSVGKPLPEVSVRIAQDGEVLVKGPNVFGGYYKQSVKTREVFDEDGWFHTGDIGHSDRDGFLFITGRKKYMIVSPSGKKVHPEDVERELNRHEAVKESVVLGLTRGTHVEIYAVLLLSHGAHDADVDRIAQAAVKQANAALAPYQHVQNYTVWKGFDFPRSATRKPKREKIRETLAGVEDGHRTAEAEGEASPLKALLAALFGKHAADIGDHDTLTKDLGMDSLLRIELVEQIEEERGVAIAEHELNETMTVAALEEMIRKDGSRAKTTMSQTTWQYNPLISEIRAVSFGIVRLLVRLLIRVRVRGDHHLADITTPFIIMPNHRTLADGGAVAAVLPWYLRGRVAFATALDVMRERPISAPFMKVFFGSFPLARREEDDIADSLYFFGKLLDEGSVVVVFPEGKVNREKSLLPLKKGAGLIAVEMGVPVVPLFLDGLDRAVSPHLAFPTRFGKQVTFTWGAPLTFSPGESYEEATKRIQQALHVLSTATVHDA